MNEQYTLGINFGTTNTTAAIQRGGAPPEMLRLGTNSNAIPSAVLAETRRVIDGEGIDHLFLTGGSSLIPLVQREFQQLTSGRVGTLGDPNEVTALGALLAPNTAPRTPAPARAGAIEAANA